MHFLNNLIGYKNEIRVIPTTRTYYIYYALWCTLQLYKTYYNTGSYTKYIRFEIYKLL